MGISRKNSIDFNTINFNWRDYINNHVDLQQHKIRTENGAKSHYKRHGNNESRIICNEKYISKNTNLSDDYTFVILRCVKRQKYSFLWEQCYHSIRKFHPNNKIVIIDNNSNQNLIHKIELINCELIQHNSEPSGEILPYFYFLKHKWSKYMIYFQDSMFLNAPLCADKLNIEHFKFFWHFNPGVHDHKILIPYFIKFLKEPEKVNELFLNQKQWFGSFGLSCTMSLKFLEFIEEKHQFTNLVSHIKSRNDRKALERIFGLLCSLYHFGDVYNSYFGNVCTCPNFGKNTINDYKKRTEHVKKWEELFTLSKIFVCR